MSYVIEFLDKSRDCKSLDDLSSLVQSIFYEMGFPKWAYQTESQTMFTKPEPVLVHNYPAEWEQYYVANECSKIDPVITLGKDLATPFQWSNLIEGVELTEQQKSYYADAHSCGLNDGLAVPISSPYGAPSVVSMVSDESGKETASKLTHYHDQLIAISCAFHCIAKDFLRHGPVDNTEQQVLSARERECLTWIFHGKTTWEISQILSISERTVIFHIENTRAKLNAANRYHAVLKALVEGHIAP